MLVSDESGTNIGLYLTDCIACRITRLRASCLPVPAPHQRVTHMGLAWDSSPVASQHSYGGFQCGLPVSSLLMARFWVLLRLQQTSVCNPNSRQKQKPPNTFGDLGLGEAASKRLA